MTSKWTVYRPKEDGLAPKGFVWDPAIWEFQFRDPGGTWMDDKDVPPFWNAGFDYRYRRRATAPPVNSLPEDDAIRGQFPLADGLLDYFPNALAEVALVSRLGNEKHNPGEPMHWSRGKSTDHRNKIMRHLIDAGRKDKDGVRHSASLAWRALANLQEELEREEGYPLSRGSKPPEA